PAGIAAQQVGITPLTLIVAEDSLHWQALLGERRAALAKSDSVIGTLLTTRAPEVTWLLPDELRRAARRAPGIAPDPDQMGTAILLRGGGREEIVPDPLRHELRTLAALVGAGGGRFVLVPAGLVFRRTGGPADGRWGGGGVRLGRAVRRDERRGEGGHAAAQGHAGLDPAHRSRAQGPAHHAGGRWVPLGDRGAAPGVRPVRQCAAREIDRAWRTLRRRGLGHRAREHRGPVCRIGPHVQ